MSHRYAGPVRTVLGLLLAVLLVGIAQAQEGGTLEGKVVNGTADGAEIGAGLPICHIMSRTCCVRCQRIRIR